MDRIDWLTLFVGYRHPGEPELKEFDPLQLQKGMFLLWQAADLPDQETYEFQAYDFGPMSPQLYPDIERLQEDGLVSSRPAAGRHFSYYGATDAGRARAEALAQRPQAQRYLPYVEVIQRLLQQLSFQDVVSGIYAAYPAFAIASAAPDLRPSGEREARRLKASMLRPEEIRVRADALVGMRQIGRGEYVTREQLRGMLNGA